MHEHRSRVTLHQMIEVEFLCRHQLILVARLARMRKNIDLSEDLLSDLKSQLCALRSVRAEMRKSSTYYSSS